MTDGERATTAGHAARGGLLLLVVWLSVGLRVDVRPPTTDFASRSDVEAAFTKGDYAGAERIARQRIASLERAGSFDSPELARARDQLIEALLGSGKGGDPSTLLQAQRNLDANGRVHGSDSLEVSNSLRRLADVHFQRGEYSMALDFHERGLALRTLIASSDEREVAHSLERLAATQMRMERYDAAQRNLEKAHGIRARRVADDPLPLATTLELIAWLHRYSGNYAAAKKPLEEALTIRRRLTPGHSALITPIELQGDLLLLEGDIASAASTWHEALALAERTVGREHPIISTIERRLAYSADAVGNRAEARFRLERALLIAERTRSECDPELISLIDYSAGSLIFDGEYVEARRRFVRTLSLTEQCFGPTNSNTATVVFNLASLAAQMGDLSEADRLYRRAIQAWSALGPAHPYVAKGLDALAEVLETSGDLPGARDLLERALAIRRKIRPDHPDVAWTLTNIARVVAASGDVPLALRQLTEAAEIYQRSGAATEPDHLARTITEQGEIEARRGNYLTARNDFTAALTIRERLFGAEHPLTAESRLRVAAADFALARYDDALNGARQARRSGLDHVKFTVRYLPERRALAYASRTTQGLGLELSLVTTAPAAVRSEFLDAVIRSRSIVLDELGARAHALSDPRPEVAAMQARLNAARQRFANLMLRSLSESGASPDATEILNSTRREREDAEQALAEQSATFRSQLARSDVGVAEVRNSLPPGHALVSFVRYDRTVIGDLSRGAPLVSMTATIVPSYIAFVLRSGEPEPSFVLLGGADIIDALVTDWRRQMIGSSAGVSAVSGPSQQVLGDQLRRLVWDPLATHISGMNRVFVVPDGTLHLLPIGALPAPDGRYLVERRPVIHYLSAERDAVRPPEATTGTVGLLAIGGPSFADASSFAALSGSKSHNSARPPDAVNSVTSNVVGSQRVFRGTTPGCPSFQSISFDALPASSMEAESIASLWDRIEKPPGSHQTRVLTGPFATEAAFKQLSSRRRVLHLATHGFFLGDECAPALKGTRAVGGLTSSKRPIAGLDVSRRTPDAIENPLIFSGLALAGANRRTAAGLDEEDGILTAEEVAALDLDGVEWAVLSACDTGLGTVAAGEGVLGLRRAFQVAGVRTVIMSLWSVEDRAARQWMEALYRARLVDRLDTADSVRYASLTVLRERRAQGQSTHPFFWAAFVAAGDWR
jgi:CHAT domain-containing protein/tetratricopeptide (TPR) repeat protein